MPLKTILVDEKDYDISMLFDIMDYLEECALKKQSFYKFALKFNSKYVSDILKKIFDYGNKNFEFQEDHNWEDVVAPYKLNELKKGDCDDFALWTKTILDILKVPNHYILLAKTPRNYSHIAVLVYSDVIDLQRGVINLYDYTKQIGYPYYKKIK